MSIEDNIEKVAAAIYSADNGGDYHAYVNNYGTDNTVVRRYQRLALAAIDADSRFPGGSREMRTLRWKLKTVGQQLGRAGERIHLLRSEVAALRLVATINPGTYFSNLERLRAAYTELEQLRAKDKLPQPVVVESWHGKATSE